jgi:hypothetical protein
MSTKTGGKGGRFTRPGGFGRMFPNGLERKSEKKPKATIV